LGLSIAARIIEEHGGKIHVKSRPGEGATFTITLPLRKIKHGYHTNS
jgi:signal transduction histidine kinase